MKLETMSHKDLVNRCRALEEQNAVLEFMLTKVQAVFDEYLPLVAAETDKAIVEHKRRKAVA